MDLLSSIIIYFAFGVPFGVLSAYLRSSRLGPNDLTRVFYHLTFWPWILVLRFFAPVNRFLGSSDASGSFGRHTERESTRRFRTQQSNLEGLSSLLRSTVASRELKLPFEDCIQHPNPPLGAKCFHRRQAARLEQWIERTQEELSKAVAELQDTDREKLGVNADGLERPVRDLC